MGLDELIDDYSKEDAKDKRENKPKQDKKACPSCSRICEHIDNGKYLCQYSDCEESKFEKSWRETGEKGFLRDVDMKKVNERLRDIETTKIS